MPLVSDETLEVLRRFHEAEEQDARPTDEEIIRDMDKAIAEAYLSVYGPQRLEYGPGGYARVAQDRPLPIDGRVLFAAIRAYEKATRGE
jgi:hypothetical protein